MNIQVLVMIAYKEEPQVLLFNEKQTEAEIADWLCSEIFETVFEDGTEPKTLEAIFEAVNMNYSLTTQEVYG